MNTRSVNLWMTKNLVRNKRLKNTRHMIETGRDAIKRAKYYKERLSALTVHEYRDDYWNSLLTSYKEAKSVAEEINEVIKCEANR